MPDIKKEKEPKIKKKSKINRKKKIPCLSHMY